MVRRIHHQYIALRWTAKHELVADSINIWLLWSQNIFYIRQKHPQLGD